MNSTSIKLMELGNDVGFCISRAPIRLSGPLLKVRLLKI